MGDGVRRTIRVRRTLLARRGRAWQSFSALPTHGHQPLLARYRLQNYIHRAVAPTLVKFGTGVDVVAYAMQYQLGSVHMYTYIRRVQ